MSQKRRKKKLPLKKTMSPMKMKYMKMMTRRIMKSHLRSPYRSIILCRILSKDKIRMRNSLVRKRSKTITSSEETPKKIRGKKVPSMKSSSIRYQSAARQTDLNSRVP